MKSTKTNKITLLAIVVAVMAAMFSFDNAYAQKQNDHKYIKEQISQNGCRNVAITKSRGDIMVYGRNGWAASSCPASLTKKIRQLHDQNVVIEDIVLTEKGEWLIINDQNGFSWSNVPKKFEEKLRFYNDKGEIVTTAVFNDKGEWIIVTKNYIETSHKSITDRLQEGLDKYGKLWTVSLNDDCWVAVYEKGFVFDGKVPNDLKDYLGKTKIDVYRLKIAGNAWFLADQDGNWSYNM